MSGLRFRDSGASGVWDLVSIVMALPTGTHMHPRRTRDNRESCLETCTCVLGELA